jgi:cyclic beta-1,2-glucan synthetase
MVTDSGAGFLRWKGLAVIGVEDDPTTDADGTWIYVKDETSGRVWSATPAPTRARRSSDEIVFHAHQVEVHHRDEGISLRTEIGVAAHDDVEVRLVTLHNESDEERTLSLRTFAEPILEARASARRHPAFSRMFVECERLVGQHGVLAWRRERDANERKVVVVQRLLWDDGTPVSWAGAETDRGVFVGRRRTMRAPALGMGPESPPGTDDATVDPAIVLGARVVLPPHARVQLALVTSVGATRADALDLARRFGTLHTARWVMHDSRREVARTLDRAGMTPELLPMAMQVASRLVLPGAPLRPSGELIDRGASRAHVWGHGISGDDPLMVVRVLDPAQSSLVRESLTLHRVLRHWQIPVDLVLLDEMASGYQAIDGSRLHEVISALGMDDRIGERGGIKLLATDQLPAGDRERLMGAARVLLDAERGSMADHLSRVPAPAVPLPDFAATRPPEISVVDVPLPSDLVLVGAHGGFTPDGREYVIRTDADHATPAPWCNVLSNVEVGCLVSESSLGTTWCGNSGENRLTPWRNDPVTDAPAEVLYLRDEETAQIWSPTPLPAGLDAPTRVRHGAGYTTYERESHGLAQSLTVFVPVDAPVKIVRIELTNQSGRPRRVTASYYAEWVLGALRESQRAHVRLDYDAGAECLLASSAWNHEHGSRVAFLSADRTPHGYTCDRTEWLGRCGTHESPRALMRWGLSGTTDSSVDPCAVLQTHLDIAAGATIRAHFVLGQGEDRESALALARRFRPEHVVDRALAGVKSYWDDVLGAVQVKTPSRAMDVMLNRWLLYQSLACRFLARSGFYQSSGAFGFRDQLQDTMGFVHVAPELVREHLIRSARHQFEEGDVLHWWHPPLDRGVRTRCSDDMVWLPYVVASYVEVTGDRGVLDERIPFLKAPPLGPTEHDRYAEYAYGDAPASLLEHCRRALRRAMTKGPHGLPLIGTGDWNDGMNRVGEDGIGESVWLGWFLAATMREFARLLDRIGEGREANEWRGHADALVTKVDEVAWDGAWYVRAFYDDGTPLGRSTARHCRIDSISQSWSVLAGAPNLERSTRALASADAELVREKERLVLLLAPPFHGGLHHPGYIEAYPPGVRETGGQYTHAATWLGCAYAKLGDGAAAERIFRLLNPILRSTDRTLAETYRIEPYVLAGDVYGAAPLTGRGGWSWYTGAAAWMWRLGVESILGITRHAGELRVDPCIPADWPGFEAKVRIGGEELDVIVENPHRVTHGVRSVKREGRVLRVTLGAAADAAV